MLVVEDHPGARRAVSEHAVRRGFRVHAVATASEALDWVRGGGRYDLAALDLTLPDDNTFALADRLRSEPAVGGRPIMLTAPVGTPSATAGMFDAVLVKPIRSDRFADVVSRLTGAAPPPKPKPAMTPSARCACSSPRTTRSTAR